MSIQHINHEHHNTSITMVTCYIRAPVYPIIRCLSNIWSINTTPHPSIINLHAASMHSYQIISLCTSNHDSSNRNCELEREIVLYLIQHCSGWVYTLIISVSTPVSRVNPAYLGRDRLNLCGHTILMSLLASEHA